MRKTGKIIVIIILFLLVFVLVANNKKYPNYEWQETLIFFPLFSPKKEKKMQKNSGYPQYNLKVSNQNIHFKKLFLMDTIDKKTLIREKIAPGTKGAFEIWLEAEERINYQIKFESKNNKPENLEFQIEGKDRKYKKLEEMEKELKGEISGTKGIIIHWEWKYENNAIQNWQDTRDGETIKQYCFVVYANTQ